MSLITDKAFEIGDKIAKDQNVFLVDVFYGLEGKDKVLRLSIDSENGVGLDECEKFSRAFEDEFDKNDPTKEAYCLEVTSPGVDRVLKTDREFSHFVGRKVDVKLYSAINGTKEFTGVLERYLDKTAYISFGEQILEIETKNAVYIKLSFEF